jgi:alginate O-acetyltransferase complex protein AlgI
MLFNSLSFLFVFMPVVLLGFLLLRRTGQVELIIVWLIFASFAFYAAWEPIYIVLLLTSILFNYAAGMAVLRTRSLAILWMGIAGNVLSLSYFKYIGFLTHNINWLFGVNYKPSSIVLPLGISFISFVQIAFLVDIYRGEVKTIDFRRYALFASYFPHLIAGPIIRYNEVAVQFTRRILIDIRSADVATGAALIIIGLFKKVVLADGLAPLVSPTFRFATEGLPVTFFDAWLAAIAFAFQIYFDFSGYSDVAIGLSLLFGVRLPLNFASPYKAGSIIEFWRRWHMSLSRWLRDYVYISLGGNRHGAVRRYVNIMAVMLLGGLWHGASWMFVVWGGLHGYYLILNHAFRNVMQHSVSRRLYLNRILPPLGSCLVFPAVVVAWVFFRAETWDAATLMLDAMAGNQPYIVVPEHLQLLLGPLRQWAVDFFSLRPGDIITFAETGRGAYPALFLILCGLICFLGPNSQEVVHYSVSRSRTAAATTRDFLFSLRPTPVHAAAFSILALWALLRIYAGEPGEFIYFQF